MTRLLVTVPVHNEARLINPCLETLYRSLDLPDLVLSVAEDGSTDGTKLRLDEFRRAHPDLVVATSPKRLGRGRALRNLWSSVNADVYCYVDVDLPAGVEGVEQTVRKVLHGADLAVGSRYAPTAVVRRPPGVKFASKGYNHLLRWVFQDGVYDHQCGLKAFRRPAFQLLDGLVRSDDWFWDTESIVLGRTLGLRIDEVPLIWTERRYERTNLTRLAREIPYFLSNILRLRSELSSARRGTSSPEVRAAMPGGGPPDKRPRHHDGAQQRFSALGDEGHRLLGDPDARASDE